MMNNRVGIVVSIVVVWLAGCSENNSAYVDRENAQAAAGRPISAEVESVRIPSDPALPTWVVVVDTFIMGASGVTSGIGAPGGAEVINPGEQIGPGVTAQLVSALQRVGNVTVIDYAIYERSPDKIAASLKPNERGPFIIRGTITEFSEIADASGKGESTGYNIGLALIPYVGPFAAYGHGTKAKSETKRKGMVALDVQIVDPATGRLLTSFTAEGEFTSLSATKSRTTWGNTKTSTEYASSAIGQAQRMALNNAVKQLHQAISQEKVATAGQ